MKKKLNKEERETLRQDMIKFNEKHDEALEKSIWDRMDGLCVTCAKPYGDGETISAGYVECDKCSYSPNYFD